MKNLFLNGLLSAILCLFIAQEAQSQNFYAGITTQTAPSCHGDLGTLGSNVVGGTAPYSYSWYDINDDVIGTGPVLANIQPGGYSLVVIDALGLYSRDSIGISFGKARVSSSPANCPTANGSASIDLYGTYAAPVTVSWSNGSTDETITGLAAGDLITVQATDANGCPISFVEYVNEQPIERTVQTIEIGSIATFTVDHQYKPATCTKPDGEAVISVTGTTAPYTYIWNTSPVKIGASQIGLTTGSYKVRVKDNMGCFGDYSFYLSNTSGGLSGSAYQSKQEYCLRQDGEVTAYYSGGTAPYTIAWASGETGVLFLSNRSSGYYTVTITDAENCKIIKTAKIERYSPVKATFTTTFADCNNQNGAINAHISGGTSPYIYRWSNNQVTQNISGLGIGWYNLYSTDAEGCGDYEYTFLNTEAGCQGNISGVLYQDNNNNCTKDAGEPVIVNEVVIGTNIATQHGLCSISNNAGAYSLRYPYNGTYKINTYVSSPYYPDQCPANGQSQTVSAPNDYTYNIGLVPTAIGPDLHTAIYSTVVRPGFSYYYDVYVRNVGTEELSSGTVEIQLNEIEELSGFSQFPASYDPALHKLVFDLNNLGINEVVHFSFVGKIAPTVLLNTHFNVTATAYPLTGDLEETTNTYLLKQTVVGSYDPNDIQSFKTGDLTYEKDTIMNYHIRFQNTGTFYAEFVVVHDTLDAKLDPTTLRDIQSSHPVTVTLLQNNVLEFVFDRIFLPDSNTNEAGSHGFVNYKINLKKNVIAGDIIPNSAAIYFDYNIPVLTNQVKNRVAISTSVFEGTDSKRTALVFPNPAHDHATFTFPEDVQSFELLNAFGQSVYSVQTNQKTVELNTSSRKGMHYYKATDKKGEVYSGKIIIE
ncbi:MAG: T9SS type A sorting domain-containing protein [Cytophagaceae bacterium]|nr:T9SS type A sorting domain-containing protein [Cytophagaceae bacterium]